MNDDNQRDALRSLLTPSHNPGSRELDGPLFNDLKAALSERVPTRYEDPLSWALIDASIRRVLDKGVGDVRLPNRPRFGTLPTTTLNARTVLVPNIRLQLIVVNSGLFKFCYDYLKLGLKTVVFHESGDQIEISYSHDGFEIGPRHDVQLIVELSKLLEDAVNHREHLVLQPMGFEVPLLLRMVSAMEFFLVAHEYGHIMLGHLSKKNERLHTYGVQQPLSVVGRSWGQEAAADAYAFAFLDKYLVSDAAKDERYQAGIDFLGYLRLAPQMFFVFATAAEDAQYVFDNRHLRPALSQEERMAVTDYLESALAKESGSAQESDSPPGFAGFR